MHLFITGITGFVGSWAAQKARERGHRVTGTYVDDRPVPEGLQGVELIELDLLDPAGLGGALARSRPDAILHLAGLAHVGRSWQRLAEYFQVNVQGTEHLLRAAAAWERQRGAGPVRVVVASSGEIYGSVPEAEQPISEERPAAPESPYALTKAAAERLVLAGLAPGALIARSFNLVGPGQSPIFALPTFAAQLAAVARGEQEPVLSVGNLEARRDFLHVADGAAAYLLLAERGEPGGVYNIATGEAVSIAEALARLRGVAGVDVEVKVDPDRFRPIDLPLLAGDATRLRSLGWAPEHTLTDALRDLWQATLAAA